MRKQRLFHFLHFRLNNNLRLRLSFIAACGAALVAGASEDTTIDAARQDLANRLSLHIEAITVAPRSADSLIEATAACERVGASVAIPKEGGNNTLILVAQGKRHYYHARRGDAYEYCELPSTKKRGPVRAPAH